MTTSLSKDSLVHSVADINRLFRQSLERLMAGAGLDLTPGEVRTLGVVTESDGLRQGALASLLGVEPMTVCAYLDRLETRGLVVRRRDPNDRRARFIEATGAAMVASDRLKPITEQVVAAALSGIDDDELSRTGATLRKIHANLSLGKLSSTDI